MKADLPSAIYLKDYTPPAYRARDVTMTIGIFQNRTLVTAQTRYERQGTHDLPLVLNGEEITLHTLKLNGQTIPETDYSLTESLLTLPSPGASFTLETECEIHPENNTRLEGLYLSNGTWCTQCEAEGFRRITYFIDRPDNMAVYTVRIEADKDKCPVLLSNGNLVESGHLEGNRHFAVYHDPTPKPCYLFALVAGDLVHIEDHFTTRSGLDVTLRIYVRKGDENQCFHAMNALKKSMKWDEEVYGRDYQYSRFDIVAVSDFNMGAMENTSLNIFNTALVLAHPDTATDLDFHRVESVVAHEYFHNWTGNRITCRDWFQLSLKEGLTVFRDQQFSQDMVSIDAERIDQVNDLRRFQFPEDAGALAHPVRPDNYIEINNFYTMTVYEKGAEVIRMMHTLLGPETFRKATDLYFTRHDGQAVTCEDFVKCMEDASGRNLSQFWLWYEQAGTPEVTASSDYDESKKTFTVTLRQHIPATPGQPDKKPMLIPVKIGLVGTDGADIANELLELTQTVQSFTFENIHTRPIPSYLRGFSAPVKLTTDLSDEDLMFLMVHDRDGFNRYESAQTLYTRSLLRMVKNKDDRPDSSLINNYGHLLKQAADETNDRALLVRMLTLPDLSVLGQFLSPVDPDALHHARTSFLRVLGDAHESSIQTLYEQLCTRTTAEITAEQASNRTLKYLMLRLLASTQNKTQAAVLAKNQYETALTMTDRVRGLEVLSDLQTSQTDEAFTDFLNRFKSFDLVVNKWFSLQAMGVHEQILTLVTSLTEHPLFTLKNPNRVRSLYASFAMSNPVAFHDRSGKGYRFLSDAILSLNKINPQIAARLLTPMRDWRRYTEDRQALMRAELERILATPDLSPDVFEIASKSLKG